jgi:hypothetical protein
MKFITTTQLVIGCIMIFALIAFLMDAIAAYSVGTSPSTVHAAPAQRIPVRFETEVVDTAYDIAGNPCIDVILFRDKVSNKKWLCVRHCNAAGGISVIEFNADMKVEKP